MLPPFSRSGAEARGRGEIINRQMRRGLAEQAGLGQRPPQAGSTACSFVLGTASPKADPAPSPVAPRPPHGATDRFTMCHQSNAGIGEMVRWRKIFVSHETFISLADSGSAMHNCRSDPAGRQTVQSWTYHQFYSHIRHPNTHSGYRLAQQEHTWDCNI